tara:strand:+ start:106 stop:624 length:519 start_codon:yes stop_codon:yes gene_type:complete
MKISKSKLRQIIKEELGTLREQDPAEENYVKLVNALGDIFQHHLEEVGMDRAEILRAVEEAEEIELAGHDEELEEGWKEFAQGAKDLGRDVTSGRALGKSARIRKDAAEAGRLDAEDEKEMAAWKKDSTARDKKSAAAKKERARADHHRWVNDDEGQELARDLRMRRAGYKE